MSNIFRLCAVNRELQKCISELSMLQSGWAVNAARKVAAPDYIHDVIESIGERRGRYNGDAVDSTIRDVLRSLYEIQYFGASPPAAKSVNSSVATHPIDDLQFIAKVSQQLGLMETAQRPIRQPADMVRFSDLVAGSIHHLDSMRVDIEDYRHRLGAWREEEGLRLRFGGGIEPVAVDDGINDPRAFDDGDDAPQTDDDYSDTDSD